MPPSTGRRLDSFQESQTILDRLPWKMSSLGWILVSLWQLPLWLQLQQPELRSCTSCTETTLHDVPARNRHSWFTLQMRDTYTARPGPNGVGGV
jgi:hypothetical protein